MCTWTAKGGLVYLFLPIIRQVFAYYTTSTRNGSFRHMYLDVFDSGGILHGACARLSLPAINKMVLVKDTKLDVRPSGLIAIRANLNTLPASDGGGVL